MLRNRMGSEAIWDAPDPDKIILLDVLLCIGCRLAENRMEHEPSIGNPVGIDLLPPVVAATTSRASSGDWKAAFSKFL